MTNRNITIVSRFLLGDFRITAGADKAVSPAELGVALQRHARCDWGDMSEEERDANDDALRDGGRVVSVYHTCDGVAFSLVTEADRSATTALLVDDYYKLTKISHVTGQIG